MRIITLLAILAIFAASCSPSKKTSDPSRNNIKTTVDNNDNDGSSFEKAIVINKSNERDGVAEEYNWLRTHYPGYTMISQSLSSKKNKQYDILKFKTKEGEEKQIYFDITKFFGKF